MNSQPAAFPVAAAGWPRDRLDGYLRGGDSIFLDGGERARRGFTELRDRRCE